MLGGGAKRLRINNVVRPFLGEVVSSKESKDCSCSHIIQRIPGEGVHSYSYN